MKAGSFALSAAFGVGVCMLWVLYVSICMRSFVRRKDVCQRGFASLLDTDLLVTLTAAMARALETHITSIGVFCAVL